MESDDVLAWVIGMTGIVGTFFGAFWRFKIEKIKKYTRSVNELNKELKETKKHKLAALSNNEVLIMQLNSIQEVWHCLEPVLKKKLENDPEIAMVLERLTNVLNMDNTNLGRD